MSTPTREQTMQPVPAADSAAEDPEGLRDLLQHFTRAAPEALHASTAALTLLHDGQDILVASEGLHESLIKLAEFRVTGFLDRINEDIASGSVSIPDVSKEMDPEPAAILSAASIASVLAAPVLDAQGKRAGLLVVADARPRAWTAEEITLFERLASVAGDIVSRIRDAARRHAELRESHARLQRNFDDALAGHVVATAHGRVLACNEEFARIAGFATIEEALATNLHSLEPEPGAFRALLERLQETPLIPLEELHLIRHDGRPARVLTKLAATTDDAGNITEIRVYLLDITQRFENEEKLRASDERFQMVELATHDVLWEWDLGTGGLQWNGAVAQRFRYTPEEVRSSIDWFEERIHPEDRERVIRSVERIILGVEINWTDEYRFLRGDGTYATVMDRGHVVRNERGEPKRMVGWMIDITDRAEAEEMQRFLAKASSALEGALEVDVAAANLARLAVPALADFCLVDLLQHDGSVRRVAVAHGNPDLEKFLNAGLTTPASNGSKPMIAHAVAKQGISDSQADCGTERHATEEVSKKLGIAVEAGARAYTSIPITAHGRRLGAATFGLGSDNRRFGPIEVLTARELAQRAGPALENAAQYEISHRTVAQRNEVLGLVSHDLRVPLNTIVAVVALLEDTKVERRDEVKRLHDIIRRAADQMTGLISDLLDATRMESEHFTIERAPASPAALIAASCESLRPLAVAKKISLECSTDPKSPTISVDSPRILRVIGNLVSNALKFSPAGSTIRVRAETRGSELWISVQDSGVGISPAHLPRVFDRFWSGPLSHGRGSGLGLSIADGIVRAHGGRIWVESEERVGSKFTFTLPLRRPGKQEATARATDGAPRPAEVQKQDNVVHEEKVAP